MPNGVSYYVRKLQEARNEVERLQSKNRWAELDIEELVDDFGVHPLYWNGVHQACLNETNVAVERFKTKQECQDWCDEKNKDATETPTIEIERLTTEVRELGRRRRALWDELVKVHTNAGYGLGEAQIFADIAEAPGDSASNKRSDIENERSGTENAVDDRRCVDCHGTKRIWHDFRCEWVSCTKCNAADERQEGDQQ